MSKILLTGSSGLLGRHLKIEADRPSHKELDINDFVVKEYDLIVHCAAYTDVQKAEEEKAECFRTNVQGTLNLLLAFPQTPMVYISSEYARNPVNFYSLTKQIAEELILYRGNCLIIRTLFKPSPWPYDYAFADQYTGGDYVEVIAPLIDKAIMEWGRTGKRLMYIGTGRKTIFELAKRTKPDVLPNSIKMMKVPIPNDYT